MESKRKHTHIRKNSTKFPTQRKQNTEGGKKYPQKKRLIDRFQDIVEDTFMSDEERKEILKELARIAETVPAKARNEAEQIETKLRPLAPTI